jgi:hypothetical protein
MLLKFNDEQLAQIRAAAQPLPWALREAYLQRVAMLLGNGDVQRPAAQAQRELIGIVITE